MSLQISRIPRDSQLVRNMSGTGEARLVDDQVLCIVSRATPAVLAQAGALDVLASPDVTWVLP